MGFYRATLLNFVSQWSEHLRRWNSSRHGNFVNQPVTAKLRHRTRSMHWPAAKKWGENSKTAEAFISPRRSWLESKTHRQVIALYLARLHDPWRVNVSFHDFFSSSLLAFETVVATFGGWIPINGSESITEIAHENKATKTTAEGSSKCSHFPSGAILISREMR